MSYQLIAQGDASDLRRIPDYQDHYREGDRGYLALDLLYTPSENIVEQLSNAIRAAGVERYSIERRADGLRINFQVAIKPLALIVAAIIGIAVLVFLLIAWRLFREVGPAGVVGWTIGAVVAIIVIVVAVTALIRAVRA